MRIGNELGVSTHKVQEHKIHLAGKYIEELEEKVKKYEDKKLPKKPQKPDGIGEASVWGCLQGMQPTSLWIKVSS